MAATCEIFISQIGTIGLNEESQTDMETMRDQVKTALNASWAGSYTGIKASPRYLLNSNVDRRLVLTGCNPVNGKIMSDENALTELGNLIGYAEGTAGIAVALQAELWSWSASQTSGTQAPAGSTDTLAVVTMVPTSAIVTEEALDNLAAACKSALDGVPDFKYSSCRMLKKQIDLNDAITTVYQCWIFNAEYNSFAVFSSWAGFASALESALSAAPLNVSSADLTHVETRSGASDAWSVAGNGYAMQAVTFGSPENLLASRDTWKTNMRTQLAGVSNGGADNVKILSIYNSAGTRSDYVWYTNFGYSGSAFISGANRGNFTTDIKNALEAVDGVSSAGSVIETEVDTTTVAPA